MGSQEYRENRQKVAEIYGGAIDNKTAKHPNTHHIVTRSDVKRHPDIFKDLDVDSPSNLVPITRPLHREIHARLAEIEREENPPKTRLHKRKH
jgi:hypothetical protein